MGMIAAANDPNKQVNAGNNFDMSNEGVANNRNIQTQEQGLITQAENTGAPTAAAATTGPAVQASGGQYLPQNQQLIDQLATTAAGKGPSVATDQLKQGEQDQVAQQLAVLGSQNGAGNRAGAARQAADTSAQALNKLNQNAATAKDQETLNAQNQEGAVINNATNAQIGLNENNAASTNATNLANATMQQQTNQGNLQAKLQEQGLSDQQIQALLSGATSINSTEMNQGNTQNQLQYNEAQSQNQDAMQEQNFQAQQANALVSQGMGVVSSLGSMGMMSDETMKEDVEDADDDMEQFLNHIKAYSYRYKDEVRGQPTAPEGEHTGVMAQDLNKSETGKQMVKPDGDGHLTVDYGQGLSTMMAALAYLNDRQNKLEDQHGNS